jgi:hypothetical protein
LSGVPAEWLCQQRHLLGVVELLHHRDPTLQCDDDLY